MIKLTTFFPLAILIVFSNFLSAQTVQTFTANGSFTVPCGVNSITVQCWGGGGGGAGDNVVGPGGISGGGGGGGGYSTNVLVVVPGQVIPYTVGAGGTGGNA